MTEREAWLALAEIFAPENLVQVRGGVAGTYQDKNLAEPLNRCGLCSYLYVLPVTPTIRQRMRATIACEMQRTITFIYLYGTDLKGCAKRRAFCLRQARLQVAKRRKARSKYR